VKTVEEHLSKVVWDERLTTFVLAYRVSTHETRGATPASRVFGRELRLTCDLLIVDPSDKEQFTIDDVVDVVDRLHDIHHFARQHFNVSSDRMKDHYDRLANSAGFQGWTDRPGP
jgi:hypothetical protein